MYCRGGPKKTKKNEKENIPKWVVISTSVFWPMRLKSSK